jgi:glyoxylase-like metal-dependent hydrolase (beta-lactamase superfamily II)
MGLKARYFVAGSCTHPEFSVIRGGRWGRRSFPALVALIEHPSQGWVLFDSGYSPAFHALTAQMPWKLYALLTRVSIKPDETVAAQLRRIGIAPEAIRHVVLSHFHADHIGGLADFPQARFSYLSEAYTALKKLGSLRALHAGFLKGLLPPDFEARSLPVEASQLEALPELDGLFRGHDLFGDGSLKLVALPGHAAGHAGLLFDSTLLIADAVWLKRSLDEDRPPNPLARLVMDRSVDFDRTFAGLRRIARQGRLALVPSHCQETLATLPGLERGR